MDLRTERAVPAVLPDQLGREVLRMLAGEPDPLDPGLPLDPLQQPGELETKTFSVGIYVLSEQHHLPNPLLPQPLDLFDDLIRRAGQFGPAGERDYTKRAVVVAPLHHSHVRLHLPAKTLQRARKFVVRQSLKIVPCRTGPLPCRPDRLRKSCDMIGPQHEIDRRSEEHTSELQ